MNAHGLLKSVSKEHELEPALNEAVLKGHGFAPAGAVPF
jgi:hypothetical protein